MLKVPADVWSDDVFGYELQFYLTAVFGVLPVVFPNLNKLSYKLPRRLCDVLLL